MNPTLSVRSLTAIFSQIFLLAMSCCATSVLATQHNETDDFEERAAKAAQTEKGFYESGGARDTDVIPLEMDQPKPRALTPAQAVDAEIAAREAAKRAAERQAAQPRINELKGQLQRSRVEHGKQLADLQTNLNTLKQQLATADQDKKDAEAALAAAQKGQDWLDSAASTLGGFVGIEDPVTKARNDAADADKRIRTLKGQIATTQTAAAGKVEEIQNYERRLAIEIIKADPDLRAAAEAQRLSVVTDLTRSIETQKEQITAGEAAFDEQIEQLTKAIALATARGLPDVAKQYETDRRKVREARTEWRASMDRELTGLQKTREYNFQENRDDGLGATNSGEVRSEMRQAARAAGEDVSYVDEDAVGATETSAGRVASGAPKHVEFKSIFNEITSETVKDFFQDLQEDELTWYEFSLRFGAYSKGVARGTRDAVKDLLVLVKELGDTTGESFEQMLEERLGIKSNVFGRENLELLRKLADNGAILFDLDNPEGDKLATQLVGLAEQLATKAERKLSQVAASGDDKKALEMFGYGTAQVVGAESAVAQAVVVTTKVIGKGFRVVSGALKADDAAKAAGKLDTPSTPGDGPGAPATGTPPVRAPPKITGIEVTVSRGTGPKGGDEIAGGTITLADGRTAVLTPDSKLGAGSFSTAFTAKTPDGKVITGPDGKPLVIKVTKAGDDGLDRLGYQALDGIDPDVVGVPKVHGGAGLGKSDDLGQYSGGVVTVLDEGPSDFKKVNTGKVDGPDGAPRSPEGQMTAGQAIAFDKAMRALNEKGWVWLDNKYDNYSFEHLGGDNWKLVILDPGGMVPVTGKNAAEKAANARKVQKFIDNPEWTRSQSEINDLFKTAVLAENFDDIIDWALIKKLIGGNYDTLAIGPTGIKYNPQNGTIFKKTNALAAADTPEDLAKAQAELRKAQTAGGGRTATGTDSAPPAGGGGTAPTKVDRELGPGEAGEHAAAAGKPGADDVPPPTGAAVTQTTQSGQAAKGSVTGAEAAAKAECPPVRKRRLDLVSRVKRILAKSKSNIVPSHGEVISDVAVRKNEIIMVRPVNQHSTRLISDNFATKGMGIKGKSSDWGPHAGTIPVDPKMSKLGNPGNPPPTPNQLRTYENYNKKALGEPYQEPIKDSAGNITGWKDVPAQPAIAKRVQHPGPDGQMIDVLADIETGQPITADYDLFAVGGQRGSGAVTGSHPEMGAISSNEIATMEKINDGVKTAGFEGGNVVHHGPANRFANELEAADFPITAFTPDGNVHTINNVGELGEFYATWKKAGYNLTDRPGWNLDPNAKPSGKFAPLAEDPTLADYLVAAEILGASKMTGESDCPKSAAAVDGDEQDKDPTEAVDSTAGSGGPTTGGSGPGGGGTGISIGGFDGISGIPPVYFEFGGGDILDYTGISTTCPEYCSWLVNEYLELLNEPIITEMVKQQLNLIQTQGLPACEAHYCPVDDIDGWSGTDGGLLDGDYDVEVEQVFNVEGNNPFDPNNPLGEFPGQSDILLDSPSSQLPPPTPPGPPPPPSGPTMNPWTPLVGSLFGNAGCNVFSTTLGTQGTNVVTLNLPGNGTVPFNIDPMNNNANSQSNNLIIFGAPGHTCGMFNPDFGAGTFFLNCSDGMGGSCIESFNN